MSSLDEKINKIESIDEETFVDEVESKKSVRSETVDGKFQSMLENADPQILALQGADVKKPTLEEVVKTVETEKDNLSNSAKNLIAQTQEASQQIEQVKSELQTENLDIKKPVSKLMRNKLTHIDDSLRIALSKAGTEAPSIAKLENTPVQPLPNPVSNFLDHLTNAQEQLEHLGGYLQSLVDDKQDLSPANMLAIQIKVSHIQQELEFFTNLLNKALESTKALMNVQV